MVMCFAPDCRHYRERDLCKFYRFPIEDIDKKPWIKLIRRDRPGEGVHVPGVHVKLGQQREGEGERFRCGNEELDNKYWRMEEERKCRLCGERAEKVSHMLRECRDGSQTMPPPPRQPLGIGTHSSRCPHQIVEIGIPISYFSSQKMQIRTSTKLKRAAFFASSGYSSLTEIQKIPVVTSLNFDFKTVSEYSSISCSFSE
ncbi:hypothetical protein RI129_006157 [Pyrocoelia pectoralis]|uniref:THAP-type domain-containing protein n=1 Tax=Pyrocoelia pectoralis TaxID=417401 RepID=A0AAN7ZJI8_9COLE